MRRTSRSGTSPRATLASASPSGTPSDSRRSSRSSSDGAVSVGVEGSDESEGLLEDLVAEAVVQRVGIFVLCHLAHEAHRLAPGVIGLERLHDVAETVVDLG